MTKLMIKIIKWYQKIPLSSHKKCKYLPTCSNYAIGVLQEFGFFKGSYLTIKRILKCNPWSKGGYDPIPTKGEKNEKRN